MWSLPPRRWARRTDGDERKRSKSRTVIENDVVTISNGEIDGRACLDTQ
jgi:hypothetical protein